MWSHYKPWNLRQRNPSRLKDTTPRRFRVAKGYGRDEWEGPSDAPGNPARQLDWLGVDGCSDWCSVCRVLRLSRPVSGDSLIQWKSMAPKIALPYRVAIAVATVVAVAIGARGAYQRFAQEMTPQPAPTQVEKLVARLDARAECDRFRAKLLVQANGTPTSGATQYSAVLTRTLHDAVWIEGALTGPAIPAVTLQSFLGRDSGKDFPIGSGDTPVDAVRELDTVLARVTGDERIDVWRNSVIDAIESYRDAERKHSSPYYLEIAHEAGELVIVQ